MQFRINTLNGTEVHLHEVASENTIQIS